MNDFVRVEWQRALDALESATRTISTDPDTAASRAYYAAFHAITAVFALRGQTFVKHTAVRAAVHRDLIHTGEWPSDLGAAYDKLADWRDVADYGGIRRVDEESAAASVAAARQILDYARKNHAELTGT